jgi:pimeloyl-ACP methyl ester carboxylesterase
VPFEFSEPLMQQMPYARLLPVDDAGHLPQWEKPDIVQPAIVAFLREVKP